MILSLLSSTTVRLDQGIFGLNMFLTCLQIVFNPTVLLDFIDFFSFPVYATCLYVYATSFYLEWLLAQHNSSPTPLVGRMWLWEHLVREFGKISSLC